MVVVYTLKFLRVIKLKHYSFFILFLFISTNLLSQSTNLDKLKQKREQYQKEIKNAKNLLQKKGKTRKSYLSELNLINAKIGAQNKIIDSYKIEINNINNEIDKNEKLVNVLSDEINNLKSGYEKLIIEANKQLSSNYNEFMLLFSSSSFSEAYRRFNLMKQYASYRKKQGLVLIETKEKHDSVVLRNKRILDQKKISYNALINEVEGLKISVSKKQRYIADLKKDEDWLRREIKKKEKSSNELQLSIEKLIKESKVVDKTYAFSNFKNAKGNLSWPVSNGIITSHFGEHNHAVLKGVKIKNNGIDITASKENQVKSVYEGTVSRVIAIPGYNKAVIIRHGNFLTVYANLSRVDVKSGQVVKSQETIGQIFADKSDKNGILHFEIWEENEKINPVIWLRK